MATFVHGYGLTTRRAIHHSSVFYYLSAILFLRAFIHIFDSWEIGRPLGPVSLIFLIVLYPFLFFVYLSFCIDIPKQAKGN